MYSNENFQIKNFGQTPSQLLVEPHAPRQPLQNGQKGILAGDEAATQGQVQAEHEVRMVLKFMSNSPGKTWDRKNIFWIFLQSD